MEIGLIGAGNIANVIAEHAKDYHIACVHDSVAELAQDFSARYKCGIKDPGSFPKLDPLPRSRWLYLLLCRR